MSKKLDELVNEVAALKALVDGLLNIIIDQTRHSPTAKDVATSPDHFLSILAVVAGRFSGVGQRVKKLRDALR